MVDEQGVAVSQDEVLAQLRTRGFETGFQKTVLRDFKGKLQSITGNMRPPGQNAPVGAKAKLEVIYTFENLEVIKSTEPYPFPVAQITFGFSNRDKSGMGIFGMSVDKIINAGVSAELPQTAVKNHNYLINKTLHMVMTPGHMLFNSKATDAAHPKGQDQATEAWELMGVEGEGQATASALPAAGQKSTTQLALEILDNKTEQAFYQAAFATGQLKSDGALVSKIIAKEFLPPLVEAGVVTVDSAGVYHLVK